MQGIDYLQQSQFQNRVEQIKQAKNEGQRMALIRQLFRTIQESSVSVIDQLQDGVPITNLDQVTTSFHNEMKNNTAKLLLALKDLKLSSEEQSKITNDLHNESIKSLQDDFKTIHIKSPRDRVTVSNLHEIAYPSDVSINNFQEVTAALKNLEEVIKNSLNINIPAPQVTVTSPDVKVEVPPQSINFPDFETEAIVSSLQLGLKKLRTNNTSNPLFVRLTDSDVILNKLDDVRNGQMTALSGFPNQMYIKGTDGSIINPASDPGNVTKAVANIASSTTDGAIVSAIANRTIRVVQVACVCGSTATNITFNSKPAGAGTAISPLFANGANGGEILPYNPKGWFDTNQGEGLTATTSSGSTTGILIGYLTI